jgi:signal transduction histidine kinase/ActR/RegA family two-component response regulator
MSVYGPAPDFRVLFESAPGLYLVLATDLTIVAASDAYLRATMTERAAIVGRPLFEVVPDNPGDPSATGVANLRASLARVMLHKRPDAMAVQKYDIRRPESQGGEFEERHWSPVNSPVLGPDGAIAYIIHRVEDVTEFVRLKQRGHEQSQLTAQLKTRAVVMEAEIFRRAQELQESNRRLRELQAQLEERVETRTAALRHMNEELQREMAERQRTEQALRESEEQLRQSQKLEAIGRLAGGIAHDFNNLLTAMMGHTHLARAFAAPAARTHLDEVQGAAERASTLTRQLLAFSRQQVLEPRLLDLNAVILGVDGLLRRLIGEDIDFLTAPAAALGAVRADPGQLEQVILNLAVNARDAMPGGGALTIETANADFDEGEAMARVGVRAGAYVMLTVSDTGAGMTPEVKARMFEPFFTTKEAGRGTGLGLSMVHGIVSQSGGHIEVYSEPGHGTTVKIYLPRAAGVAAGSPAKPEHDGPLEGDETVLVVEDEAAIRRMVATALRLYGYQVVEAADAREAIELCERDEVSVELLVTDVIMPGMDGVELVSRLLGTRPDLRVLFISGYTDRALGHQGLRPGGTAFLEKPFTPEKLARKVRETLDEPHARAA